MYKWTENGLKWPPDRKSLPSNALILSSICRCFSVHNCIHLKCMVFLFPCRSTSEMHRFVWQLLQVIASEERLDLRRYLKRAMEFWSRQGKLTSALVEAVCSHTTSKEHLQVQSLQQFYTTTYTKSFLKVRSCLFGLKNITFFNFLKLCVTM